MIALSSSNILEDDAVVWRYMSLAALKVTLSSGKLRLTRLDRFDDPFEGTVTQADLERSARQYFEAKAFSEGRRPTKSIQVNDVWRRTRNWTEENKQRRLARLKCAHASCWRLGDESEGMWRLYCGDNGILGQGIAIRTRLSQLRLALQESDLIISPIVYRTYHEGPPFSNDTDCFFHKRRGFSHEQELRLLIYNSALSYEFTRYIAGFSQEQPQELPDYLYLPFDLAKIADALVVSPYATEEYETDVDHEIRIENPALCNVLELSELSPRRHPPRL